MTKIITTACSVLLLLYTTLSLSALPFNFNGEKLPSLAPMLEVVQPAIVNISTAGHRQHRTTNRGSGVIVDAKKGLVVTNHHVIAGAQRITITTQNGQESEASLIGSDPESDVAVIKVEAQNLVEIKLGVSEDLRVGDFVVAVGSPFGLSQTVTSGIVSALGRAGLGIEGYEDFIQTDASINPGNSGGALVNLRGELIGINTAIVSRSGGSVGVGFSIPVDMVKSLMSQLIKYGEVKRGLLGVRMQDLTLALADVFNIPGKKGVVVNEIIVGSAAEESNIMEGDVIVGFNSVVVENVTDLRNAVGLVRPGANARVSLYREGTLRKVNVVIKQQNENMGAASESINNLGEITFLELRPQGAFSGGLQIRKIAHTSLAYKAGLRSGDIIVGINKKQVTTIKQLKASVKGIRGKMLIKLIRNGRFYFLVME